MNRTAKPMQAAAIAFAAALALGPAAQGAGDWDSAAFCREGVPGWQAAAALRDPAGLDLLVRPAHAEPYWRADFNPLHLERTGGKLASPTPRAPRLAQAPAPQRATFALAGLGLATVMGGRPRRRSPRRRPRR